MISKNIFSVAIVDVKYPPSATQIVIWRYHRVTNPVYGNVSVLEIVSLSIPQAWYAIRSHGQ